MLTLVVVEADLMLLRLLDFLGSKFGKIATPAFRVVENLSTVSVIKAISSSIQYLIGTVRPLKHKKQLWRLSTVGPTANVQQSKIFNERDNIRYRTAWENLQSWQRFHTSS